MRDKDRKRFEACTDPLERKARRLAWKAERGDYASGIHRRKTWRAAWASMTLPQRHKAERKTSAPPNVPPAATTPRRAPKQSGGFLSKFIGKVAGFLQRTTT